MKLLILGGTVFLGRHLVESALARGHEVTVFTRGQRNPDLFPEVEKLRGDRLVSLEPLKGRRWDAVIDTSGYIPRAVKASAELLAEAVEHYTFISTISVYSDQSRANPEEAPVGKLEDETVEEISGGNYGPLKALCEQAAERAMPGRVLTLRPGLIVGPHDPSDRFTYWPVRIARGGEVLIPDTPDLPVQVIDARDLAEWNLDLVEARRTGLFNAVGPAEPLTFETLIDQCLEVAGSDARLTPVSEAFLLEQKVGPWLELPIWLPADGPRGIASTPIARALEAGLTFRPLAEIIRDTIAWDQTRPADLARRAGLKPEREAELLAAWHARGS